jgi:hypothetical protein
MQALYACCVAGMQGSKTPVTGPYLEVRAILRLLIRQGGKRALVSVPSRMLLDIHAVMVDVSNEKIETLALPLLFRLVFYQDAILIVDIRSQFAGRDKFMNPCSGTP